MFRFPGRSLAWLSLMVAVAGSITTCGGSKGFDAVQNIEIVANPSEVRFTGVVQGDQESRDVEIRHAGDEGTLQLERLEIIQPKSEFFVTDPEKTLLEPGESVTVTITYIPEDNVPDVGTLRIHCNAVNALGGVFDVALTPVVSGDLIRLFPSVVSFGEVPGGTYEDILVRAENEGAQTMQVNAVRMKGGSSPDFTVIGAPEPLPNLGPGEKFEFSVRYTPLDGNADAGTVVVDYTKSGVETLAEALCDGQEISPNLLLVPGKIDFNKDNLQNDVNIELDSEYTRDVILKNGGGYEARIQDISFVQGPDIAFDLDQFTLEGWQAADGDEGVALAPGAKIPLTVHFHPTNAWAASFFPVARLVVSSDDPNAPETGIDIFARLTTPDIEVAPPTVDFNFVAQEFTANREVTIFNRGQADLIIEEISFPDNPTGEFGFEIDEDFGPIATVPSAHAIPPDETVTFKVTFTNEGGVSGTQFGKMKILSNDPVDPEIEVSLQAQRTKNPECKISLVPPKVNYGVVPHGTSKEMSLALKNIGSGNCTFQLAKITDCGGFAGLFTNCDAGATILSSHYKMTQMPPPVIDGMAPGDMVMLKVKFTPPATASIFDFENYPALLSIQYREPYSSGDGSYTTHTYPENCISSDPLGGNNCQPNIEGKSGTSRISVLPDHLDFGVVTVGCYSQTMKVSLYNTGNAPLEIKNAYIDPGCPSLTEFKIKELPPLPQNVDPQNPLVIKVVYHPQNLGDDQCTLIIESTDQDEPQFTVPLEGAGTFETENTDEFVQITGQNVDVLFSIDSSGSMSEEVSNVADNVGDFAAGAATWQNDFQLGLIGVCIDTRPECWNTGNVQGPGVLHNDATSFKQVVKDLDKKANNPIGNDGGCSPDQEAALESAHLALTLPRIFKDDLPCTSDSECQEPYKCRTMTDGTKACAGWNGGFMRDDAALEIILISDEEDQSPATPAFYIDFFNSIKGFANQNLMHVHAIVGDKGSGCTSNNGDADAGNRYIEVQEATGGVFASICDSDFSDALTDIGNVAFGLKKQFFLTRTADPSTVKLWVNDVECTGGWVYDQPSNSIIFDEFGSCMPNAGDEITVWYKTVCYNS